MKELKVYVCEYCHKRFDSAFLCEAHEQYCKYNPEAVICINCKYYTNEDYNETRLSDTVHFITCAISYPHFDKGRMKGCPLFKNNKDGAE